MATKRYTSPERLFTHVLAAFETEDEAAIRDAVLTLVVEGPLRCTSAVLREREALIEHGTSDTDWLLIRAELLQFVRSLVRTAGQDASPTLERAPGQWSSGLSVGRVTFHASAPGTRTRVRLDADGPMRELAALQWVLVLQAIGLGNVRKCGAPDCEHLYLKVYRREFCSARCQKRIAMRRIRTKEREADTRLIESRRRRRTERIN